MIRHTMIAAVAICGLTSSALAQVKIDHRPKYVEGSKSKVQIEMYLEQTLTLNGTDLDTKIEQFLIIANTVGKRLDDGTVPIDSQFEVLQTNLTLPGGNELAFDSGDAEKKADNAALEPIMSLLRASSKAKWQTLIGEDHKIKSVKYTNDAFASVDEALKKEADPEKYKKQGNQDIDRLPTEPVKEGDTWKRSEQVDLGSGQTFEFEKEYKYLGTADVDGRTMDKIGVKHLKVTYTVDNNPMFQLLQSDLKPTSSEGTLWYDRQHGVVTKMTVNVRIQGDLKLSIGGQEFDGKLDLTMKPNVTVEYQ